MRFKTGDKVLVSMNRIFASPHSQSDIWTKAEILREAKDYPLSSPEEPWWDVVFKEKGKKHVVAFPACEIELDFMGKLKRIMK